MGVSTGGYRGVYINETPQTQPIAGAQGVFLVFEARAYTGPIDEAPGGVRRGRVVPGGGRPATAPTQIMLRGPTISHDPDAGCATHAKRIATRTRETL